HPGRSPDVARRPVPAERGREAPASVVEGRPAPGLVRDPGPAVRRPGPVAVRVGRPARAHARRPDVAHLAFVAPMAVRFELPGVGIELVRQVRRGAGGAVVPAVAGRVPAREVVLLAEVEAARLLGLPAPAREGALALADLDAPVAVVEHGLAAIG